MTLLAGICILVLGLYSLLIFFLAVGLFSFSHQRDPARHMGTKVSVLVPFRDEAEVLPALIRDLVGQRYPMEDYEVILVNDHSGDASPDLVREGIEGLEHFRCLDLPEGSSGKKAALALGVEAAQHQWILQTDADCRLGKDFLAVHADTMMENKAELVAGWVLPQAENESFLSGFEALDAMALSGAGAGSFVLGRPLMCSGANMAYSKSLYRDSRHLDPVSSVASGDDMFLLIAARKMGKKMVFLPAAEAAVSTRAVGTWNALLRQRVRWGGKSVYYRMPDIQAMALLVFLAALCTLALPLLIMANPATWHWAAGIMILKMLVDFLLLSLVSGLTKGRKALRYFLPVWVVYQFVLVLSASASLLFRSSWKDRLS